MTKPVIGLGVSTTPGPEIDPIAEAIIAESVGFDFVSASDHLHGETPTYEPWSLLTWIAASTSHIRVASRVLAIPYRPPAVTAKMAETVDRLSNGRLILGLGAGYLDDEFRAFGLPVTSLRDKIDGVAEAIDIVRGLWTEPALTFHGRLHLTEAARIEPKPDHQIPIWLGTYGPRALDITGRMADGWIPSLGFALPERVVGMRDRVRAAADAAGRDPESITMIYNVVVRLDKKVNPDKSVVVGPPDAVISRLVALARLGFGGFNLMPSGHDRTDLIERLGREVIPALKAEMNSDPSA